MEMGLTKGLAFMSLVIFGTLLCAIVVTSDDQINSPNTNANMLCISNCQTCPRICSPPPPPTSEAEEPTPSLPPLMHSPPPFQYSHPPPPPSPPPPLLPPPPPPRYYYVFGGAMPPPPPTTTSPGNPTHEYPYPYYYYYTSEAAFNCLPAAAAASLLSLFSSYALLRTL